MLDEKREHVVVVGTRDHSWKISTRGKLLPDEYGDLYVAQDTAREQYPDSIISVREYNFMDDRYYR